MKIMGYFKNVVFCFLMFVAIIQTILCFELTQRNKELYLECIKLKQDLGNENIQCEKILLDNIKKDLKNKNSAEEFNIKNDEENSSKINKNSNSKKKSHTQSNEALFKDQFNFDDYIERIEKFIEGEINHLNKFRFFVGDFKERSKKYISLNLYKKNQINKNILSPNSNEDNDFVESGKKHNQIQKSEKLTIKKKLRGISNFSYNNLIYIANLKSKTSDDDAESAEESDENLKIKKQIKFKQLKNNGSNRGIDEDNLVNDFAKLKEKLNLSSESSKEETNDKSAKSIYHANEIKKKANNIDMDSIKDLISSLRKNKMKNENENKKNKNSEEGEVLEAKPKKDPKLELMTKLKSLGLNFNNGNQEATTKLFKKFLDESLSKEKPSVNQKDDEINKEKEIINKNIEDYNINDISESLSKLKNQIKGINNEQIKQEKSENKKNNDLNKKSQSSIVDISEKLNLESLKNLINNTDLETKKENETTNKKADIKATSNENNETDKIKATKSAKNEEKKDSKKNDFNFSLGEIESQIEMLKNLSIKP